MKKVTEEVLEVWNHHFGPRLIFGKDFGKESFKEVDKSIKMIKENQKIEEQLLALLDKWKGLEKDSRRLDRCVLYFL